MLKERGVVSTNDDKQRGIWKRSGRKGFEELVLVARANAVRHPRVFQRFSLTEIAGLTFMEAPRTNDPHRWRGKAAISVPSDARDSNLSHSTFINPLLAEGQLHGSLAQGLGQVLMERIVYDGSGQLVTGTLMDYAIPCADDMPAVAIEKMHTRSLRNPLGAKGLGDAGCIAIPPALVNAVVALAPFGVMHVDMPLTPENSGS